MTAIWQPAGIHGLCQVQHRSDYQQSQSCWHGPVLIAANDSALGCGTADQGDNVQASNYWVQELLFSASCQGLIVTMYSTGGRGKVP